MPELFAKLPVPVNAAETVCVPGVRALVEVVATPDALTVTGEPATPSIVKITLPVGVPPADVTVAVNVTLDPVVDGFCEEETAVVVAILTVWPPASVPELLP